MGRYEVETCTVVEDWNCKSPANVEEPVHIKTQCFGCGLPVCTSCSRIRTWYHWKRKRICLNCHKEEEELND